MVLVDTSVWIGHLKQGNAGLKRLLSDGEVACHPFVIGELACGNLSNRHEILTLLSELPQAGVLESEEVLVFIERHNLAGLGVGLIDVHLLASAWVSGVQIWTLDRRLKEIAGRKKVLYGPAA